MDYLRDYLNTIPALQGFGDLLAIAIATCVIALIAFVSYFIIQRVIIAILHRLLRASASERDDILVKRRVFEKLSHLAPALVIYVLSPLVFSEYVALNSFILKLSQLYIVIAGVIFFDALISAGVAIYGTFAISKNFPITSLAQVGKLLLYFFGVISVLSLLLGQSPLTFLAGLSALAAVFMFVFKDPILGFVAGIQLSANRMVAVGDWIEIPSYQVDGDVM